MHARGLPQCQMEGPCNGGPGALHLTTLAPISRPTRKEEKTKTDISNWTKVRMKFWWKDMSCGSGDTKEDKVKEAWLKKKKDKFFLKVPDVFRDPVHPSVYL
jgi:hypothetical protein